MALIPLCVPLPRPGQHVLIYTDGRIVQRDRKPDFDEAKQAAGIDLAEVVRVDREIVMLVDEEGMLNGSLVNPYATALLVAARNWPIAQPIRGNVVLLVDSDLQEEDEA